MIEGGRRGPLRSPLVTIAMVTLNAEKEVERTLDSIFGQQGVKTEILAIDGASTDRTIEILRRHDTEIDYWRSAPDDGPYDAMNKAAALAKGQFILFMNAGDWFQSSDAVMRAMATVKGTPDVIYGHHVYRRIDGDDELHLAADFSETLGILKTGHVSWDWLKGMPGHQATLTRTELLKAQPYDARFPIAADYEFLFRVAKQGATFHNTEVLLSTYVSGGFSWRNIDRCIADWREISLRYTENTDEVRRRFDRLFLDLSEGTRRPPWDRETSAPTKAYPSGFQFLKSLRAALAKKTAE